MLEGFALGWAAKLIVPPIASVLAFIGMQIMAQADAVESWPQVVGGGILVTVAGGMILWTLRTSKAVESRYLSALEAQTKQLERQTAALEKRDMKIDELEIRLRETAREAWDWERKYQQEYDLRVSLEQAGVVDRRRPGDIERVDGE